MSDTWPDRPKIDPTVLEDIANHAERVVAWLQHEQAEAARHGHAPGALHEQITGWRFVADAMREWDV